jgi:hypothetical protein
LSLLSAFRSNRDLQERVEKIERTLRAAELDWDELYAKCRKLLGRVAKERATIERHAEEETPQTPAHAAPENGRHFGLSDRQRELQQQILRRRAGA